jgi:hypothetical protein
MFRIFFMIIAVVVALIFLAVNIAAHPAWGIAADNQGQVYVSDLETVWKIDAQGKQSVFRQGVSGRHTHEINIDEAGNLYGEDLTYSPTTKRYTTAIWKMTPAGVFSYILAPTTEPPKGISIWKDRRGNTYLAQQSDNSDKQVFLLKRTPGGVVTTLVGSRRNSDEFRQVVLYDLGGMAFAADGSLYLTDRANIQKVTVAGEITTIVQNIPPAGSTAQKGQSSNTSLLGLTLDAAGNIYAADFGNGRVLKITPGGEVTTLLRAEPAWSPTGVAYRNGELYILESGKTLSNPRVRKLSPDGKVSILATIGISTNAPVPQAATAENLESVVTGPKELLPSAMVGTSVGVFALGLVIRRLRKRKSVKLFEQ